MVWESVLTGSFFCSIEILRQLYIKLKNNTKYELLEELNIEDVKDAEIIT